MNSSFQELEQKYKDGQIIFCEYEKGDSFYFIKSGRVKLLRLNKGEEIILDILYPGVFFGEMSVIEPEPRTALALAIDDVVLIRFGRENFERVVLENSALTLKLIMTFVSRIWTQEQRLHVYKFKEPEPRIVAILLNLKIKTSDTQAQINASLDDISKWAGVSSSDTKKVLNSMTASQIITAQSDKIIINDLPAIERLFSVYQHILQDKN